MIVDDFESAISAFSADHMDMGQVMGSLQKISLSVKKLIEATKGCNNEHTTKEIEILQKIVDRFKDPKTFAYEMGTNIVVNGVDIYREMQAAYTNYLAKQYESFGKDIGVAMTLVFIGASDAAKLNPGAAKVMESMAEMELYPTITGQVYGSSDNKKWIEYLGAVASEEEADELPNYNNLLMNL